MRIHVAQRVEPTVAVQVASTRRKLLRCQPSRRAPSTQADALRAALYPPLAETALPGGPLGFLMRKLYLPLAGGYRPCCVTKPFGLRFMVPDAGRPGTPARNAFVRTLPTRARWSALLACLHARLGLPAYPAVLGVLTKRGAPSMPALPMPPAADAMCAVMHEILETDFDQVKRASP